MQQLIELQETCNARDAKHSNGGLNQAPNEAAMVPPDALAEDDNEDPESN